MTPEKMHEPLPENIFQEIRSAALGIWNSKDDTFGYVSRKVRHVEQIENKDGDAWEIVRMFDHWNQLQLMTNLSPEAEALVYDYIQTNQFILK